MLVPCSQLLLPNSKHAILLLTRLLQVREESFQSFYSFLLLFSLKSEQMVETDCFLGNFPFLFSSLFSYRWVINILLTRPNVIIKMVVFGISYHLPPLPAQSIKWEPTLCSGPITSSVMVSILIFWSC